ncbi:hypothetical protein HNP46_005730 [Pseudomonas nitritireducens]|uniref:Uncharacterized protein n=1 Tax=Pseudomonas nitroreducens TaxID=46680 RepID=A0A7W7KRB8_PSENT|nr:hypothetical protein [Pseudomonas nitritireducens]MBB4866823.1 hypothetical protein [Pseudomonas nitritireducens]
MGEVVQITGTLQDAFDDFFSASPNRPKPYRYLPDRFLNKETFEKLMVMLLPNGVKPKQYEKMLRDFLSIVAPNREAIRSVPVVTLFQTAYYCHETREKFYDHVGVSYGQDSPLVLEERLPSLCEKLNTVVPDSLCDLPEPLLKVGGNLADGGMYILSNNTAESDYKALSRTARDYVDLAVNLILSNSGRPTFIKRYFEAFPWLRDSQSTFYKAVCAYLDEYGDAFLNDDDTPTFQGIVTEWTGFLADQAVGIEKNYSSRVTKVAQIYQAFHTMASGAYGPINAFDAAIREDAKEIIAAVESIAEAMKPAEKYIKNRSLADVAANAKELFSYSFSGVRITEDFVVKVVEYSKTRRASLTTVKSLASAAIDRANKIGSLTSRISETVNSGDLEGLSKLAEWSTEISEHATHFSGEVDGIFVAFDAQLADFKKIIEIKEAQLAQESSVVTLQGEVGTAGQAVRDLEERLSKSQDETIGLGIRLAEAELEVKRLAEHNDELAHAELEKDEQIGELKQEVHNLKVVVESYSSQRPTDSAFANLPVDDKTVLRMMRGEELKPVEILRVFEVIAPDRVVILPSAYESADDAEDFRNTKRLSSLLESLIYPYLEAFREGKQDSEARHLLNGKYGAKESTTVENNKRLRSLREFDYNGETVYFDSHVSAGGSYGTANMCRIHFKVIDRKIVIAWCGEHLEVAGTN